VHGHRVSLADGREDIHRSSALYHEVLGDYFDKIDGYIAAEKLLIMRRP
jgi:hypothetical protein